MLTNLLLLLLLAERLHARWADRLLRRAQQALLPRSEDLLENAEEALFPRRVADPEAERFLRHAEDRLRERDN